MSRPQGEAIGAPPRIGPFRILSTLGQGGMGVVYRGEDERGRQVAIKTVRVPRESDLAGIRLEIHALTRIEHPGVVRIVGQGVERGLPWYAMELLVGATLQDFWRTLWDPDHRNIAESSTADGSASDPLARTMEAALPLPEQIVTMTGGTDEGWERGDSGDGWPIDLHKDGPRAPVAQGRLDDVLTLARRLCDPLAFIHGKGIVHRDLKPNNIFIRPDGRPVLMDFGLVSHARGGVGREALEVAGKMVGTVGYMAPEQILGQPVDARTDLYAFGCILYELLTGRLPFLSASTSGMFDHHLSTPPVPPSQIACDVPSALDQLVLGLLEKRPRERIGHADDVAKALVELGAEPGDNRAPDARARAYLYRPEIAGREGLLADLARCLEGASDGRGAMVLLAGESGVGKTCVAAEVARLATVRRIQVVVGECLALGTHDASTVDSARGAPLHPFARLLQSVADRCRQHGRARTGELLGVRAKILRPYQPALAALPGLSDIADPPELTGAEARHRVYVSLAETLVAFARDQPLLLVIDDLQWADEMTLGFLASLGPEFFAHGRVVVLGTYRSDEMTAGLRALVGAPGVTTFEVGRLDEPTVGAIVGDMLAMSPPPESLVKLLARHTEGNPFFVAEYLRAAVAEGLLYREGGRWRLAEGDNAGDRPATGSSGSGERLLERLPVLPRSLRELVGRRLAGLDPVAGELLEAAAVLGREFALPPWLAVAGREESDALEAAKALIERQVLQLDDDGRYRFVHDKLREVAYDRIPLERRHALHALAAQAIERDHAGSSDLRFQYQALARHFREAGVWSKAVDYLERAAEQAIESFSNREALAILGEVIALSTRVEGGVAPLRLARWEHLNAEAHFGIGEPHELRVHSEKALAHLGFAVPRGRASWMVGLAAQAVIRIAHGLLPSRHHGLHRAHEISRQASAVYARLFDYYVVDSQPIHAFYCGLRNLNLAEGSAPTRAKARGYTMMSLLLSVTPLRRTAHAWAKRAIQLAEEIGDPATLNYVYCRVACLWGQASRWDDCNGDLARAIAVAREASYQRGVGDAQVVSAAWSFIQSRFTESLELGRSAREDGIARGDGQIRAWGSCSMAQIHIRHGDDLAALRELDTVMQWVESAGTRLDVIWFHSLRARARLQSGDRAGALADADLALRRMQEKKMVGYFYQPPAVALCETYHALLDDFGGGEAVRRDLLAKGRRAVAMLVGLSDIYDFVVPWAHHARGEQARCEGNTAAGRHFRAALAGAEARSLRYEAARAHLSLGALGGPERMQHLEQALATFTALGCAPDALRARALLDEKPTR